MKAALWTGALATALIGAAAGPAAADAVADFYTDKTVTVVVPATMGGSIGLYGQLFSRHIGKHIPGQPEVITQSMPGASGAKAAAWVFNAGPKDGTVIAEVLSTSITAPVMRGAKFDPNQFEWLGSIAQRPTTISVWHTAPATDLAGCKKHEVILGTGGMASSSAYYALMMNRVLGTKFKMVAGYPGGGELNQAMEKGEINGRYNFWTGWTTRKADWLRDGKLKHIVQIGPKIKAIPDVPSLRDLMPTPKYKKMVDFLSLTELVGLGFWIHPDVPDDRAAALKTAFAETMKDPEFLADTKARNAPVEPVSAAVMTSIVHEGLDISDAEVAELKKLIEP